MNLSKGFKKVQEDDKTVTMAHENGHKLQIVKSGLSPEYRKQLSKLPLHQSDPEEPVQDTAEDDQQSTDQPAQQAPVVVNVNSGPAQPQGQIDAAGNPVQDVGGNLAAIKQANTGEAALKEKAAMQDKAAQERAAATAARVAPNSLGAPPPAQPQVAAQPEAAPQPPSTTPNQGQTPFQSAQNPSDPMNALPGYQNQIAGEAGQEQARAEQANTEAGLRGNAAASEQHILDQQRAEYQNMTDEVREATNDVRAGHINANHYLESMDAGKKISTAIGLILGGIGGGLLHQENPVMKFLNSQIERDLEGQKAELGRKNNLLSALQNQYHNATVRDNMFRAIRANILTDQVDQAAAKSASKQAPAIAQQFKGQMQEKYAPLLQTNAALEAAGKMSQNEENPIQKTAVLSRYLVSPARGATPGDQTEATKELNGVQKNLEAHKSIDELIDKMASEETLANRIGSPIQAPQRAAALKAQFYPIIQKLDESHRLTPEVLDKMLEPLVPGLKSNKATVAEMRDGLHRLADTQAPGTATLEKFQVPVPKYTPRPVIQNMGGVPHQKVPGGWKRLK